MENLAYLLVCVVAVYLLYRWLIREVRETSQVLVRDVYKAKQELTTHVANELVRVAENPKVQKAIEGVAMVGLGVVIVGSLIASRNQAK